MCCADIVAAFSVKTMITTAAIMTTTRNGSRSDGNRESVTERRSHHARCSCAESFLGEIAKYSWSSCLLHVSSVHRSYCWYRYDTIWRIDWLIDRSMNNRVFVRLRV